MTDDEGKQMDAQVAAWRAKPELDDEREYYMRSFLNDHVFDEETPTDEDVEHFKVLLRSLLKFHERDAKHKGLWRYFGAIDSAFQTRAKATRSYNVAIQMLRDPDEVLKQGLEEALDDPVDLINYAVFFIRNVEEGRFG